MSKQALAEKHMVAAQYFYNVAKEQEDKGIFENLEEARRLYLKAAKCYEKATEIEFNRKEIWEKIGDIYTHLAKFSAAIKPYKEASTLDPNDTKLSKKLARAYLNVADELKTISMKRKYYLKTIELLRKYLHASPADDDAWILLGHAYSDLEDYEKAQQCYNKAIELQPNSSRALTMAARNQVSMKNYEAAIKLYEQDCKVRPESHHPFMNLAMAYAEIGDFHKAIEFMKKAVKRGPDSWGLWEYLEDYYAHLGDYNKAKECRNKAIEISKAVKEGF